MLPAADEILLQRITLRGEAATIDSARAPLKTALEQTTWPATAPGEFLFLRRVDTHGNPREIAARAASHARRLADNAVDGWSAAASSAPAVRFRNHGSLTACLVRDLLQGNALRQWYWRRWKNTLQRPRDEALVTLLQREPLHLPAVIMQLRHTPVWQSFWQTLGSTGAERLLMATAQATGWNAAVQKARTLVASGVIANDTSTSIVADTVPTVDLGFLRAPATDPRPLLAALMALWQHAPASLNQPGGPVLLQRLARIASGETVVTPASNQPSPPEIDKTAKQTVIAESSQAPAKRAQDRQRDNQPGPTLPVQPAVSTGTTLPFPTHQQVERKPARSFQTASSEDEIATAASETATPMTRAPDGLQYNRAGQTRQADSIENETGSATGTADDQEPLIQNCVIEQGGLFYLLNFLNLAAVQAQLPVGMPGAGWCWLYNLATALGCPPARELLEFFARESGLKNGELTQQLPIPSIGQLLRLGAERYGDEVWQSKTWLIPARLIATASHLDLHFRLNDTNLAVRRVGLDINPGWLPWLGRVVTFHYGSGLEPQR